MWVGLLRTVLFLVFFFALALLTMKQQQVITTSIQSGRNRKLLAFLLGTSVSILSLAMFWSLTGLFSVTGVVALIIMIILSNLLYQVVGAISGFTLPRKEQKIGALGYIYGVMIRTTRPSIANALKIAGLLNLLTMLVIFWILPFRDARAIVLIAILHFIVGQLLTAFLLILTSWPIVTSEHIDNDMRDAHLTMMFTLLFMQTILLLISVALAEPSLRTICQQRHWAMPNVWLIVALPMATFLFIGVLPFFIGIYRRRAEENRIHEWYVDWLNEISKLLILPDSDVRKKGLARQQKELEGEIQSRYSDNALYEFYEQQFHEVTVAHDPALDESHSRRLLTGERPMPARVDQAWYGIVANNYENLFEWDLRFKELRNMLDLRQIIAQADPVSIGPYIEKQLNIARENKAASGQRRSVIAATVLGAFSSLAGWVASKYGDDIITLIQRTISR